MARSSGIFGSYDYTTPGEAIGQAGSNIGQEMFKVALLSKQMELEQQNRLAEMQKAHELNQVSPEQAGALAGLMGVPQDKLQALMSTGPISQETLGKGLEALGMQARASAMINRPSFHVTPPDANGQVKAGFIEPMTGQFVSPPQVSLEKSRGDKLAQADSEYQAMHETFQGLSQVLPNILTQHPEAAGVPLQQLSGWFQSHGLPLDPQYKAFLDAMPSLGLQYAKMQTGTVRGWEMAKADIAALPNSSDSLQSATEKLNGPLGADTRMLNKIHSAHQFYDPANLLSSPLHPKEVGANSVQPVDPIQQAQQLAAQEFQRRQALKQASSSKSNGQ